MAANEPDGLDDFLETSAGGEPPAKAPSYLDQVTTGAIPLTTSTSAQAGKGAGDAVFSDTPAKGDEITPTSSPIDAIAGGIPAMAEAAPAVLGNEAGAISLGQNVWAPIEGSPAANIMSKVGADKASDPRKALTMLSNALEQGQISTSDWSKAAAGLQRHLGFAKGGEVQKMAEGGPAVAQASAPAPSPQPQAPAASSSPEPAGLDDFLNDRESQYDTAGNSALAAVEGLGEGATFGLSTAVERGLGRSAADIRGNKEAHPAWNTIGQIASFAIPGAPEAEALSAAGKAVPELLGATRPLAKAAIAAATEGAMVQGGDEVSKMLANDPQQSAETMAANIGLGAILGGAAGTAFHVISPLWTARNADKVGEALGKVKSVVNPAPEAELGTARAEGQAQVGAAEAAGQPVEPPKNFEEMARRVQDANLPQGSLDLPLAGEVKNADQVLGSQFPMHPVQEEALTSKLAQDKYSALRDTAGKEGDAARMYEGAQRYEAGQKLDDAINNVSPGYKPTTDAYDAGTRLGGLARAGYEAGETADQPLWQKISQTPLALDKPQVGSAQAMEAALRATNPKIKPLLDSSGELRPYSATLGIEKGTYRALKEQIAELGSKEVNSFDDLRNIRKQLDSKVDIAAQGQANNEIRALKKGAMDYIQDEVQKVQPGEEVRDLFKRKAIREEQRELMESAFKADMGSKEFGQMSNVEPDQALKKVFSHTNTVDALKNILGPDQFNKVLSDYLAVNKAASKTPEGLFSSNKFKTFLNKQRYPLDRAFDGHPTNAYGVIHAATDKLRLLPDAASKNPSGTAKTFFNMLKNAGKEGVEGLHWGPTGALGHAAGSLKDGFAEVVEHRKNIKELNGLLEGSEKAKATALNQFSQAQVPVSPSGYKNALDYVRHTYAGQTAVSTAAKNLFQGGKQVLPEVMLRGSGLEQQRKKLDERLKEIQQNPGALENVAGETGTYMPNHATALAGMATNAANYINSQRPQTPPGMPLDRKIEPSIAQKAAYNRLLDIANRPLLVMNDIKSGAVTHEDLTHLKTLYPSLYTKMINESTNAMNDSMASGKHVPYGTRMGLSLLLGQPLDSTMTPQSVLAAQPQSPTDAQGAAAKPPHTKKGTAKLGKMNELYQTQAQSAEKRRVQSE